MASSGKLFALERLLHGTLTPYSRPPRNPSGAGGDADARERFTDSDHIAAAARWLARAQDATGDGGVASHFTLGRGFGASYPETTGYIVPTFLRLSQEPGMQGFEDRASTAIEFLLNCQLPDGAFPAGQVDTNRTIPSVFNTAQIICGLVAWHRHTKEQRVLDSAIRAADWLVAMQDPDGSWKRHVYHDLPTAYTAFASCWVAELGAHIGEKRYSASAAAHMAWVTSLVDVDTGWFDRAGFTVKQHRKRIAVTHTIAYTVGGVLMTAELLDNAKGIAHVQRAAGEIANRLEQLGWLPGLLDWRWHRMSRFACVTGSAQMALIWMRLYERSGEVRWMHAAELALETAKGAQEMRASPVDISGAIPGSDPIWGSYMRFRYPNWAAKFFIDALFDKRRLVAPSGSGPDTGSPSRVVTTAQALAPPSAPPSAQPPKSGDTGRPHQDASDVVTFFPDWRGDPYINNLLSALADEGWVYEIVGRKGLWFALLDAACGHGTIHMHWFEGFNPRRQKLAGLVSWLYLPTLWLAGRRGRLVWTVHNVVPHEGYAPYIGPAFLRLLARSSSRLLVHFDQTRDVVEREFAVTGKVFVTPAASYGLALGPRIDRATARARIHGSLSEANILFVQIGSLRSYKRPATTVAAFRDVAPATAMLLVAGPTYDESIKAAVVEAAGDDPRIILRFERLPDEDLATALCAADWSICPYTKIDNPGALNISLSYGAPIIAPLISQVKEMTIDHPAVLYSTEEPVRQHLGEAIARAASQHQTERSATTSLRTNGYREQARRTIEQYREARNA